LIQYCSGTYGVDRGLTNDESAHCVNALLFRDFLHAHPSLDFLGFGIEYYEHFPRVSIGHWPPLFYVIQAVILAVFGRDFSSMLGFQAVTAGLTAAIVSSVVRKRYGFWAGLAAGAMVLCSPWMMFYVNTVMIDVFLGLLVLLASLAWARYTRTSSWRWSLIFAALASGAILSKGNGFGLALLPLLYCLFQRDFSTLGSWKTWVAALFVGCLTIPWYALTYKISADGLLYHWGWEYTRLALPSYSQKMLPALGVAGIAALLFGAICIVRSDKKSGDTTLASMISATAAMFLFQCLAPAGIEDRYLITLVPTGVVVAAYGVGEAVRRIGRRYTWAARPGVSSAVVAMILLFNAAAISRMPSLSTFHMDVVMRTIIDSSNRNPLILVTGCPRAEGALIAAGAQADTDRSHYIIRGFKALASDDFMGTRYCARFPSSKEVGAWVEKSGIGWIVVDTSPESMAVLHARQVLEYMDSGPPGWRVCAVLPHRDGETRLYVSSKLEPSPALIKEILREVAPQKIIGHYPGLKPVVSATMRRHCATG
jgi:hypothetical protein